MSSDITSISSGLDAIFKAKNLDVSTRERKQISYISVDELKPSSVQPRKNFDPIKMEELSESILQNGILQPLIVRKNGEHFEIIAGERRWRASKKLALTEVPVIVENVDDNTALAYALIENIQRENLNVVEEARTYQKLIHDLQISHDEVAHRVGKSRPFISNYLRLLALNADVLQMLETDKISMGHARALLTLSPERQYLMAQEIIEKGLSVRDVEKKSQEIKHPSPSETPDPVSKGKSNYWSSVLSKKISAKVSVKLNQKGSGKVIIHVDSPDEVEWLVQNICLKEHFND